jgi:transposase
MNEKNRLVVLDDDQWAVLGPLIDECRPRDKTEPVALCETIEAIVWRHQNGAKWRSVPPDPVPWWRAAQTFIRWSQLSVWERLLERVQERGVDLGMAFLDGTSIRAHHKATGTQKEGYLEHSATCVKRLADLVAAMAPVWGEWSQRPAIPAKSNEAPVACPSWIYSNRNRVECLWARLKEWRAVATRYEKTARAVSDQVDPGALNHDPSSRQFTAAAYST